MSIMIRQLRRTGRMGLNYLARLDIWRTILRRIKPADAAARGALFRSALAAPVTAFGDLYRWRDPVLLYPADVTVPGLGQFTLRSRCDDLYHVLPAREPALIDLIRARLQPGDVFVDAGANIGVFTVLAAGLVAPGGRVIAVEMMPDTAMRLRHHIALNGALNVTVFEQALSDKCGETVQAIVRPGHFGQATIARGAAQAGGTRHDVATTTLADILADVDEVALMKIDVEGAELGALRGAGAALRRIAAIAFEVLDDDHDVRDFLIAAGYRISRLDQCNYLALRGQ